MVRVTRFARRIRKEEEMMKYDEFLELLKYRRSIRKFKPDPIPDEYITQILDAAHYAMSGANSQPWQFIVVKDPEVKEKIFEAYVEGHHEYVWHMEQQRIPEHRHPAYNIPPQDKDDSTAMLGGWNEAPVYIVVLEDPRKQWGSVLVAQQRGRVLISSMAHCTAVIHLAAASLGLGTQRVDVALQQPFRELLGYPEPLNLEIIVPLGYRAYEPGPPHRLPLEGLVHFDKYDMGKYLHNEDFLKYLQSIRKLGRPGYRVVIGEGRG
jgi:nitroreductase